MRKFYIFKINKEMSNLSINNECNLYYSLEKIYKTKKKDLDLMTNVYEQIVEPLKRNKMSRDIFLNYKENVYYQNHLYKHVIINKYRPENSSLYIYNTYILLESDAIKPVFFDYLQKNKNYFICDFENRDYFWSQDIKCFNKLV